MMDNIPLITLFGGKRMKAKANRHHTQWAGQFGVAHELVRRGYLVAFTLGNALGTDLLCQSPEEKSFSLEVKTLSSRTYYLCQDHLQEPNESRHFVFVFLPSSTEKRPEYYVFNNQQFLEVVEEQKELTKASEAKRGKPYADFSFGIAYKTIAKSGFRDAWERNLPE